MCIHCSYHWVWNSFTKRTKDMLTGTESAQKRPCSDGKTQQTVTDSTSLHGSWEQTTRHLGHDHRNCSLGPSQGRFYRTFREAVWLKNHDEPMDVGNIFHILDRQTQSNTPDFGPFCLRCIHGTPIPYPGESRRSGCTTGHTIPAQRASKSRLRYCASPGC